MAKSSSMSSSSSSMALGSSSSATASSSLPSSTTTSGPSSTISIMDEFELMSDAKYKQYVKQVDNALKGFEYTSEWADLVNALGKMNKVLQNNTKYPVIPRRFVVGQRLAQCMHPALPSGVHLKALETYDLIFKCIGTDRLVQELSIYSNGLFPLLSHAAINVKPALLEVYQTHFVPLGERLRPALDGFIIAVLPGLEEGSDHHDTTQCLLREVSEGVSREYFYAALWRCILNNASVRLAGVSFVISQFNKKKSLEDQMFIMGTNIETLVNGICSSLLDPNILVQRAILDLLITGFPLHSKIILKQDMISIITAALTVLLRRDISLNRRLFSWFRNSLDANPAKPSRKGDHYFDKYSKPLVSQAFVLCLTNPSEVISTPNAWSSLGDLWPYRLLICLLDRPEIRKSILDNLSTEVFRALFMESKNERGNMNKTTNLLISNLGIDYTYKRLMELFSEACDVKYKKTLQTGKERSSSHPEKGKSDIDPESERNLRVSTSDEVDRLANDESMNENPNEFVGVILRKKSRKYSTSSCKVSPFLSSSKTVDFGQEDEFGMKAVGGGHLSIREACAIMDFMTGLTVMENDAESGCLHVPLALNVVLSNLMKYCQCLTPQEFKAMISLSCKLLKKIQFLPSDTHLSSSLHHRETGGKNRILSSSHSVGVTSSEGVSDSLQEIREEAECDSLQNNINSNFSGPSTTTLFVASETDQALTPSLTPSTEDSASFSSLMLSETSSLASTTSTKTLVADTITLSEEERVENKGHLESTPEGEREEVNRKRERLDDHQDYDESSSFGIIHRVKQLFALFVRTRLVSSQDLDDSSSKILSDQEDDRPGLLTRCWSQLLLAPGMKGVNQKIPSNPSIDVCSRVSSLDLNTQNSCSLQSCCSHPQSNEVESCYCRCGCCLPLNVNMSSVYDDICQLLIQSSLIPKTQEGLAKEFRALSPPVSHTASVSDETRVGRREDSNSDVHSKEDGDAGGEEKRFSSRKHEKNERDIESGQDDDAGGSTDILFCSDWIRHLLVLSTFGQRNCQSCTPLSSEVSSSSLRIAFTSISTYLSLVRILKGRELKLPVSVIEMIGKTTPLSSPVLEFTSTSGKTEKTSNRSRTSSPVSSNDHLVDPLLSSRDLYEITRLTRFYPAVTSLLWDKMSDKYSELHLQTANLLQQIHNLSTEECNPICESVICSSMASMDEVTSYETRKRFCTLFNITRDIEGRFTSGAHSLGSGSFTSVNNNATSSGNTNVDSNGNFLFQRREFDRPLFFMLDSLSHKLDSHNIQAVDWLNQCIKTGDMARILEPLLFILLHPDTSRVSVQHVNLQHTDQMADSSGRASSLPDQDAADSAAQAAAEARIYAISSTGGNVMYHVTPEGKAGIRSRLESSPLRSNPAAAAVHKVVTVTSQGPLSHSSSSSSLRSGSKWVTTRFNLPDYEVPPSHENNIISGKYTSMNMTLNPFGSLSSLTSADTFAEEAVTGVNVNSSAVASSSTADVSSISSAPGNLDGVKRLDTLSLKKSMIMQGHLQQNGKALHQQHSLDQVCNTNRETQSNRVLNVNFAENAVQGKSPSKKLQELPILKMDSDEGVLCESGSETGSETEVEVRNLLDQLVNRIAKDEGEDVDDDDDLNDDVVEAEEVLDEEDTSSASSSASDATTTRATVSESMSVNSWAKPVSVNQLHCHLLLYSQVYDSRRTLYSLTTLWNIILTHPSKVLFSLSTTSVSNRLGLRSQELQSLCARHRKSLLGKGFYSELDTESVTSFRSHTFLEVIITTCLYYIRSYYPRLPNTARLTADEILGNQKVRILSCEILRLIFSELIAIIKDKPTSHPFSSYINDLLMRCKVQKSVLHSLVSSVYNYQFKSNRSHQDKSNNNNNNEDYFLDMITELNEKTTGDSAFQEDMQKSLLKLLEQLMILEHKSSPNSMHDKEFPTHNRKGSDSKASRIRFQPQMSSLKYCPNVPIPSQAMFLSAIQTALQQSCKASLHTNWLQLVEATLPFAGRSLTRLVVCVVCQMCNNLEGLSDIITKYKDASKNESREDLDIVMTPNHLIVILKSLGNLCHHCLCDSGTASGSASPSLSPTPQNNSNTGGGSVISVNPITTLSNLLHVLTSESLMNDNQSSQTRDSNHDPLTSTRRTLLTHLARILSALRNIWKAVSYDPQRDQVESDGKRPVRSMSITSTSSFGRQSSPATSPFNGWQVMGTTKDVRMAVLDLLSPISILHGSNFMGAVAVVWYDLREAKTAPKTGKTSSTPASVIPKCSQDQMILVELIAAVKVLPMDLIIQHVKQALKTPPQSSHSRKKQIALEVCLLQFFLAYIRLHASSDKSQQLYDCWKSLLSLIRDGLNCSSNQPLAQFHLLAILHEFVQAAPLLEDRRDQKELQDVAQKLVDTCTNVAGAGLSQTRWLRRNLEVRPGPQHDSVHDDETDGESNEPTRTTAVVRDTTDGDNSFLSKFSVQALNALAEFAAPVLDIVYVSEEKEKVVPLVSSIMYYVTPYLKKHSKDNCRSFLAGSHLLSSITEYQYSRKAWRKDAFELLLDPAFFQMEEACFSYWKIIIDHLMTHDKTTFREFLGRMSVKQSSSLTLFSSKDQENEQRGQLAKRLAFILFCSEKDQYQRYMPEIQEKLIECLRMNSSPVVQSQILLCFRVLLLRMSHHHLTSLWPFIYTEMFQAFLQIECELNSTLSNSAEFKRSHSGSQLQKLISSTDSWSQSNGGLSLSSGTSAKDSAWLQLYLFACKLLDLAIALPSDELPQFQMYRWAFVGDPHEETNFVTPRPPSSLPVTDSRSTSASTSAASTPTADKRSSQGLGSSLSSLSTTSTVTNSSWMGDRLSVNSINNNTSILLDPHNIRGKSPSPSPTPSRTSFGGKSVNSNSPVLPSYSGPFEPHVVRIEKTMRLKNPNPEALTYSERKPILALTSIRNLLDLHPFFNTLVRVTNSTSLTKPSPDSSTEVNDQSRSLTQTASIDEDPIVYLNQILEKDFLEEVPWM